jgi:hypothetical protein
MLGCFDFVGRRIAVERSLGVFDQWGRDLTNPRPMTEALGEFEMLLQQHADLRVHDNLCAAGMRRGCDVEVVFISGAVYMVNKRHRLWSSV